MEDGGVEVGWDLKERRASSEALSLAESEGGGLSETAGRGALVEEAAVVAEEVAVGVEETAVVVDEVA